MKKRIISIILILALCLSLLPITVLAATGSVSVGDTTLASYNPSKEWDNGGKAELDAENKRLTLTNVSFTSSTYNVMLQITDFTELEIVLVGENSFDCTEINGEDIKGISAPNTTALTISGEGSLYIKSGKSAISCGSLTIKGSAAVTVESTVEASAFAETHAVSAEGVGTAFIKVQDNASLHATSKNSAVYAGSGPITVDGGSITAVSNSDGPEPTWYISAVSGGSLTIKNGGSMTASCTGTTAVYASSDVSVDGGKLSATTTAAGSNGICAWGSVSIEGDSEVSAEGTYPAIFGETGITISGGKVDATSTSNVGIYSPASVSISGTADVTARGTYPAIFGDTGITISGGKVDATSTNDIGICSSASVSISGTADVTTRGTYGLLAGGIEINGGRVDATGTGWALCANGGSASTITLGSGVIVQSPQGGTVTAYNSTFTGISADGATMAQTALIGTGFAVTAAPGAGYAVTASEGSVSPLVRGGSYSFTVNLDDTYKAGDSFAVKANGTPLTPDINGVYTISNITEAQTITVEGVELKTYTVTYTDGVDGEVVFADDVHTGVGHGAVTPAFGGTPVRDGHTFTGWNPSVSATVTSDATYAATWLEHIYSISADTTTLDFGSVQTGYDTPAAQTITITNTGNQPITLTPPTATNFTIGALSETTLAAGETASFTVQPKSGLAAGTYDVTLTISGAYSVSATVGLKFTVTEPTPAPTPPPVIIPTPTPDPEPQPESVTVPISGDENTIQVGASVLGTTATIDEVDLTNLDTVIGEDVQTGVVTIDFSGLETSEPIDTVEIPADVVRQIAEAVNDLNNDAESLEIVLSDGTSIEFDAVALGEKAAQAGGLDITISIQHSDKADINDAQRENIGDRPAYDINVTSGGEAISDMGGSISVHAPYELRDGEKPEGIVVYYVDEHGGRERCETSYDTERRRVNWKTDHLSLYVIEYEEPVEEVCPRDETCPLSKFADLDVNEWYHDGIHFCLENGIFAGMTETEFGPGVPLTRAMFVALLWRLEGRPEVEYEMSYTDVPDGEYYTEAVRWATSENIVYGYGDTYGVNDEITREDFVTMLYRYAQKKGIDTTQGGMYYREFSDFESVSDYARGAMLWAINIQLVSGDLIDGELLLDPQGETSRAQAAMMLMRYCRNCPN